MATVPYDHSEVSFIGDGVARFFNTSMPILETGDLVVDLLLSGGTVPTPQVKGVDYNVNPAPNASAIVSMVVAPPAASTLRVRRTLAITQLVDLLTQGPFSPETVTEIADRLTMIAQQLARRLTALESAGAVGSVVAGAGLSFDATILNVGAGDGIIANADTIEVDYGAAGAMVAVDKSAASAGVSPKAAAIDHKHDVSTAAAVELTDAANAEGNATTLARSNHTHAHGNRGGGTLHANAASGGAAGFMSGVDKALLDALVARTRARAETAAGQVFATGVPATVIFGTEIYDLAGEYNNASGVFTAAVTGYYKVSARVATTAVAQLAGQNFQCYVSKNGTVHSMGSLDTVDANITRQLDSRVETTVYLTAGQTVRIDAMEVGAANRALSAVAADNYFTVDRL